MAAMASTTSVPPSPVSPIEAAQQAIDHTRRQLFPFRLERWLPLGLLAFLDQCGRTGANLGGQVPPGSWNLGGPHGRDVERILEAEPGHFPQLWGWDVGTTIAVGAVVLVVASVLIAIVLWINSRAVFMYADAVSSGRSDIARPWREHAGLAGSFFVWRLVIVLATLIAMVMLVGVGALAWAAAARGQVMAGVGFGLLIAILLVALLALLLASALVSLVLRDFVAPIQMSAQLPCGEALRRFGTLAAENLGSLLVYVLLKIVFAIAAAMAIVLVGCLTCCLGFLPVVGQTLLQPLFYFERAWSLFLLRGMGYDLFGPGLATLTVSRPPRPASA